MFKTEFVADNTTTVDVPEAWAFGVALEVFGDWDDVSLRDGRKAKALSPPFLELGVYLHVEGVFWWWCFGKGIANINTKANVIEHGNKGPGESMSRMFDTGCICLSNGDYFSVAWSTITGAS